MRHLMISLAFLSLAVPLSIAAGPGEEFNELARGFVAHEPESLERIRPALEDLSPDCFKLPMDPGPLRSILARSLSDEAVRGLFGEARGDPETLRLVARNLQSRPGLGNTLVDLELVPLLAAADPRFLQELGSQSLLDGDSSLATAVISIPSLAQDFADELLELERPEGLCFLADIVCGKIPVPVEACALLPLYVPDVWNRRTVRPLGPERGAALSHVAESSPDHALRALAARLLLFSGTAATFDRSVAAFRQARSASIGLDGWRVLGKWYGRPVLDPGVALSDRYVAFKGAFQDDWVFADTDPGGTEAHAALLRRFFGESRSPRLAAAAIRILDWDGPDFLSHAGLRATPAPSFVELLEDFEKGRVEDPADLASLKRWFAGRVRARIGAERRLRAEYGDHIASDPGGSPVFELLPKKQGQSVSWPSMVARFIEMDPNHLFDPVIHDRLAKLPESELVSLLSNYPREEILRLLRDAPGRYRLRGRGKFGNDVTGAVNRSRILKLMKAAPDLCTVLLTPGLVASFPAGNRREAGRLLHLLPPSPERSGILADEETFAGFITATIELPQGEEIDLTARVVSGLLGTDLVRRRIADWADRDLRYRLGPEEDEPWPAKSGELSADLRAHMIRVLQEAADPALAWIAARVLAMSGTDGDIAALLIAGKDLEIQSSGRGHPLAELADRIDSPMRLGHFLMFLRRNEASPRTQREVFARIAEFNWIGRLPAQKRETALKVFYEFVTRDIPALESDRPEAFLAALLENTPESMAHLSRKAFEEAVRRLPLEESRIRLRHLASTPR